MKNSIDFLKSKLQNGNSVVIACSGGPDSMCLLSLACELKKEKDLKIICAHVNHNLREESIKEKELVENYCKCQNVIFEYYEIEDFKSEKFNEQKGHKLRYEFFRRIYKKYNANYLFTAHHGDDLIETILMRITRGSNLRGYAGFLCEAKSKGINILRPLIYVTKEEIEDYNKKNNVPFMIDNSNYNDEHTRNRYRKEVLPFLKQEEKNIHNKYIKFSNELNEYYKFVKTYIDNLEVINNNELDISKLKHESNFIKRKAVEELIKNIQENEWLDISDAQLGAIIELFEGTNRSIDLNNGFKAIKNYEKIIICKDIINEPFTYIFDKVIETPNWILKTIVATDDDSNNVIRINTEEIKMPLIVRTRQSGDKMEVKNMIGSKKVKDIFIDEKVDVRKRDIIPVITDSENNILWVAGIKKSKFTKNKTEKYDIIIKYEAR